MSRTFFPAGTEFIFFFARRYVAVRVDLDIGVESQADLCDDAKPLSQAGNVFEFGDALDMKTADFRLERSNNFIFGFAHTRKDNFLRAKAGFESAKQFAARNDIRTKAAMRGDQR